METILNTPLRFDRWEVPNRVVLQPMEGCDCGEDGSPGELTREKYLRAARSGAGIIWMEACAVCPEGRTNPGQLMLTEKNLPQFKALLPGGLGWEPPAPLPAYSLGPAKYHPHDRLPPPHL